MNIYPYVYRIDHKSGEFYIGYRCANIVPAEQDLGHKYKTSATQLSYPFEEYSITIVAEFFTDTAKTDAYDFEQALIFEHWEDPNLANQHCTHGKIRWSTAGQGRSQLTKEKISAAQTGKTHSPETRQKMSANRLGKKKSLETRQKISAARTGKKFSLEARQKMSESAKHRRKPLPTL